MHFDRSKIVLKTNQERVGCWHAWYEFGDGEMLVLEGHSVIVHNRPNEKRAIKDLNEWLGKLNLQRLKGKVKNA